MIRRRLSNSTTEMFFGWKPLLTSAKTRPTSCGIHTVKLYGRKKRARERKLGMNNKAETVQLDDRDVLRVEAAINVGEDKADQLRYHTVK